MKNFIVIILAAVLFGCAGTVPEKADLNIDIAKQAAGVYPASLEVSVIGRDRRAEPYIIVYQVDNETDIGLVSRVPPQVLVKEGLSHGLRQQGLSQGDRSNIAVVIVVKELLAKVTRPGMLYATKARTSLQLIVSNNGGTLTLDYNHEATKDSLTRPKVLDLEMLLNDQLADIVTKMLADPRVRTAITGKP
jgi:uncharacterized lipoprotein YajG